MAHTWQIQEAKSKLSELINEAEIHGPQVITKHGIETAIVLSFKDYRRLLVRRESIAEFFGNSPLAGVEIDLSRSPSPIRDTEIA